MAGGLLAVLLAVQFRARRYVPAAYWAGVVVISVFGTLITRREVLSFDPTSTIWTSGAKSVRSSLDLGVKRLRPHTHDRRARTARAFTVSPMLRSSYLGARPNRRSNLLIGALLPALLCLLAPAVSPAATPFRWRGVIEGASGTPWTPAERLRMVRWLGGHGFNAYVHAPKDDALQRAGWRNPYPPGQLADFAREIPAAAGAGVQWIPNFSPGDPQYASASRGTPRSAPLCFSCSSDLSAITSKLRPLAADGAKTFMISFDDDRELFTNPVDLRAYGVKGLSPSAPAYEQAFGRATGQFLTRTLAALRRMAGPNATLLTVLAEYAGTRDSSYLLGVRSTLDPAVGVMWTGPQIQHTDFSPSGATAYGATIGRDPIVWDNWGNTDGCCTVAGSGDHTEAFLGPYRRNPETATAVQGFFLDVANEADLNKLPLATAGAWMQDPGDYDPETAWRHELTELAGGDPSLTDAVRAFAETFHWTKSDSAPNSAARDPFGQVAPTFRSLASAFLASVSHGSDLSTNGAALLRELDLTTRAPDTLRALPDSAFAASAAPFAHAASTAAQSGELGEELLSTEQPTAYLTSGPNGGYVGHASAPDPARVGAFRFAAQTQTAAERTEIPCAYGFHGATTPSGSFICDPGRKSYLDQGTPGNAMDAFLGQVGVADAAWVAAPTAGASVQVTIGGTPADVASDRTFAVPGSACGETLLVTDGAGGKREFALPACGVSSGGPETMIAAGPPGLTRSRDAGIAFTASQDGSSFRCSLDGVVATPCVSPVLVSGLGDGAHRLTISATSPAGVADDTPATTAWTVDTRPPDTNLTQTPPRLSRSREATIAFTSTEAGAGFACSLDGGPLDSCTSPSRLTGLADGRHSFRIRATDQAGNADPSPASRSWTVDATPPVATITSAPYGTARSSSAAIRFASADRGATFICSMDGRHARACRSPMRYRNLFLGQHVFAVRARDRAGNLSSAATRRRWVALPILALRVTAVRRTLSRTVRLGLALRVGCARTCEAWIVVRARFREHVLGPVIARFHRQFSRPRTVIVRFTSAARKVLRRPAVSGLDVRATAGDLLALPSSAHLSTRLR